MVVAIALAVRAGAIGQAAASSASRSAFLSFNRRSQWSPRVSSFSSSSSSSSSRRLIMYSKPGCCLCDGLKEKIHAAISLSQSAFDLEVRDITTNSQWEKAYQFEIPVLAKLRFDGTEEVLPRLSPRLGVELILKKITAALGD